MGDVAVILNVYFSNMIEFLFGISCEIAFQWMPKDTLYDKFAMVTVDKVPWLHMA